LLESITTTGVVKYENDEITIGITTEELPKTEESTEPTVPTEPVIDEPKTEEPVIDEPTTEPTESTELPETEQ
jgi:hypothetical protein